MKQPKEFCLFVIQVGDNPKDVIVGQTRENHTGLLERYMSHPEQVSKKMRNKSLLLRSDLVEGYPKFSSQEKAARYEALLAEKLIGQGYNILSKSLRRKTGRLNNSGMMARGKHLTGASERRTGDYRNESIGKDSKGDIFSYGRKKSHEWNDGSAEAFQRKLAEKIKRNELDLEN